MSKIKYSALVSDVRNKLNGSVLSKNRYGNYIRNKTTPVNPQTTYQQNARAALAANSQAWGSLTEAQRLGWKALAAELPFTDIFGDSKILAGNSLYNKLNGNLQKLQFSEIYDAPAKVAVPAIFISSMDAVQTGGLITTLDVTISPTTIPTGFTGAVYATPGISSGRSFVKNQFRFLGALPTPVGGTCDIESLWNDRFGSVAPGQKIYVRIVLVSDDSGQQGIASEVGAEIF